MWTWLNCSKLENPVCHRTDIVLSTAVIPKLDTRKPWETCLDKQSCHVGYIHSSLMFAHHFGSHLRKYPGIFLKSEMRSASILKLRHKLYQKVPNILENDLTACRPYAYRLPGMDGPFNILLKLRRFNSKESPPPPKKSLFHWGPTLTVQKFFLTFQILHWSCYQIPPII